DRKIDVDGEVLVRPEVVDDPSSALAVDHRRVEAASKRCGEIAIPGDGLTAETVAVGVVVDGEGHVAPALRKHDPPPRSQGKERQRIPQAVPDAAPLAPADPRAFVFTGEDDHPLDP